MTLTTTKLPVWIFQPDTDQLRNGQLADTPQIWQTHISRVGLPGTALVGVIQGAKTIIEYPPVNLNRQPG